MSNRSRRILQMAIERYHESSSESDPYATDSDGDPGFVPPESSDEFSSDSEEESDDNVSHLVNKNRVTEPQPSCSYTTFGTKRLKLMSDTDNAQITQPHINSIDIIQPKVNSDANQSNVKDVRSTNFAINSNHDLDASIWGPPQGNHKVFDEIFDPGVAPEWQCALSGQKPIEYFLAFVDLEILDMIVEQTNHYATQLVTQNQKITNQARCHKWEPTTRNEIIRFIGLLGYMGIVRMNSIRDYWSKKWIFSNNVAKNVMSRNRFELLLKMLHFSDNDLCPEGDRLYKVQPLLDKIVNNYQKIYTPGKTFCIDETMIPYQGRLIFRQYNPQKAHKYGIKMFKLCSDKGYTWNMSVYAGKEKESVVATNLSVSTNIVLKLAENLLGCGRICIIDNWYTSLQLAHILLDQQTHCLGTLRANRKGNPSNVTKKKLAKCEIVAEENERGICVLKWRDKRDVLVLSTCHIDETVEVQRNGKTIKKNKAIIDYNTGKSSIDVSDQMSSYSTALRRTIRWYKKLAIEAILGTSMVNAHFIFKEVEDSAISITDFRISVVEDLLKFETQQEDPRPSKSISSHTFSKVEGTVRGNRRYCKGCYKKKQDGVIEKSKVKKVATFCENCEGKPRYCLECFNIFHKK